MYNNGLLPVLLSLSKSMPFADDTSIILVCGIFWDKFLTQLTQLIVLKKKSYNIVFFFFTCIKFWKNRLHEI